MINKRNEVKIIDFGLSRRLPTREKVDRMTKEMCTLWYRPPEILLGSRHYSTPVDMWGIGCIFMEMIKGDAVFKGGTEIDQIHAIWNLCGTPDQPSPYTWSGAKDLMNYETMKVK